MRASFSSLPIVSIVLLVGTAARVRAEPDGFPPIARLTAVSATSTLPPGSHFRYDARQVLFPTLRTIDVSDPKPGDKEAIDGVRYLSAWCEGKADAGNGEAITLALGEPVVVEKLEIAAGVWMTEALFRANNRITELAIETDDGRIVIVHPPDARSLTEVSLGGAPIGKLTIRITKAESHVPNGPAGGKRYNDSCISAVRLGRVQLVTGLSAEAVAALRRFAAEWTAFSTSALGFESAPADLKATKAEVARLIAFPFSICSAAIASCGCWQPEDNSEQPTLRLRDSSAFMRECVESERGPQPSFACPAPVEWSNVHVVASSKNEILLEFRSDWYIWPLWTLRWQGGSWHLAAEDYRYLLR